MSGRYGSLMVEAAQKHTIVLREYESQTVPHLTRAQAEALDSHFSTYVTVAQNWRSSAITLQAKQYVGFIVLDDVQINIQPKVPVENLFYMLTYAYDLPEFRQERVSLGSAAALFDFVVEFFARRVERLGRQGIYRQYVDFRRNEPYLRGRLQMNAHLQRNAVHSQRFYQQVNEFTPDILENQILNYTLWKLSRFPLASSVRSHLRRAGSAFAAVSLIPLDPVACQSVLFNRLNNHYRAPIALAHLLLQHLSLEATAGSTPFLAFLFDMNQLFERFVAYFLREYFTKQEPALTVDIQPPLWLDQDQTQKRIPDIVLRRDGQRVLVLDTKYKRFNGNPTDPDVNQMVTYCYGMDVPAGLLIYTGQNATPYRSPIRDLRISATTLDLSGDLYTFRTRCEEFAQRLAAEPVIAW